MIIFHEIVFKKYIKHFQVEEMPNDTSPSTLATFWKLVDEFVTSGRVHGLNLSGGVRKIFFDKIKNQPPNSPWILVETPKELLIGPDNNVLSDLQTDVFPRFVVSEFCYKVMLNHLNDPNVVTMTVRMNKPFMIAFKNCLHKTEELQNAQREE
jgi:hypothetical protein